MCPILHPPAERANIGHPAPQIVVITNRQAVNAHTAPAPAHGRNPYHPIAFAVSHSELFRPYCPFTAFFTD